MYIHTNIPIDVYYIYTLATSCEELTHWKRLWCWERLGAGGEGDDRGWDGPSPPQWTWVWVNSGSWWWTGRPGMLQFMGSQRVRHDWATELNWTEWSLSWNFNLLISSSSFPQTFFSLMLLFALLCIISSWITWCQMLISTFPNNFHGAQIP